MVRTLAIAEDDHARLQSHLFPGDGLEAAAILVCGRAGIDRERLCVRDILAIPYNACDIRTSTRLSWPGEYLDAAIDAADLIHGSILLVHYHPGGLFAFSHIDDDSDAKVIPCLNNGSRDENISHGSAVMVPSGGMIARVYDGARRPILIDRIWKVGSEITNLGTVDQGAPLPFGAGMTDTLKSMSVCVVGVSGTGSPTVEMLARMGVGRLVLVDFDEVESRNLNRILNTTQADAAAGRLKTSVTRDAIHAFAPDTDVVCINAPIGDERAITAASGCDALFCCVDTMEGRLHCDLIASTCLIPLFDMGVIIPTRQTAQGRRVSDVWARLDYVAPGRQTLWDRGVVTGEGLQAEDLRRSNPDAFEQQLQEGYIKGTREEAPSVIALNAAASSHAVLDFTHRFFPFRHAESRTHDRMHLSLASNELEWEEVPSPSGPYRRTQGTGLMRPLLGLPSTQTSTRSAA